MTESGKMKVRSIDLCVADWQEGFFVKFYRTKGDDFDNMKRRLRTYRNISNPSLRRVATAMAAMVAQQANQDIVKQE